MKRSLIVPLVITAIIISITSCSKEPEKKWAEPPRQKDTMYIYYPQWAYHHVHESNIAKWEDYIQDKYGFKINLTYTDSMIQKIISADNSPTPLPQDSEVTSIKKPDYIETLEEISDFEGYVYVNDFTTLNRLIEYDMIMPVEQYISQIPFFASVNTEIIEAFTDSFYRIWAIPLSVLPPSTTTRVYNKTWLEKAGMPVPETLEEFYDFAYFVSNEDPDGNEKKDTYLTQFTPSTSEYDFQDVFRAFGCYTSRDNLICYNPQSEKFECVFANENFIEAMNYIKLLWDDGLIKYVTDQEWFDRIEQDHKIASSFNHGLITDLKPDDRAYGFYITGYNETRLIEIRNKAYSFAVLKHTENVGKTINEFFTMMQSSPDSRNDLLIGIKGEDYFDYNSHYERITSEDPMEPRLSIAMYTFLDEDTFYNKPVLNVTSNDKQGTLTDISKIIETRLEYKEAQGLVIPYLGTPMVYQNTFDRYSSDLLKLNSEIGTMWFRFIRMVFEDEVPLDEAYSKLMRSFEFNQFQEKIDMLNQ